MLGFTLDDDRTLLQTNDGGSCDTVRTLAEHKLRVVGGRLRDLRVLAFISRSSLSSYSPLRSHSRSTFQGPSQYFSFRS